VEKRQEHKDVICPSFYILVPAEVGLKPSLPYPTFSEYDGSGVNLGRGFSPGTAEEDAYNYIHTLPNPDGVGRII